MDQAKKDWKFLVSQYRYHRRTPDPDQTFCVLTALIQIREMIDERGL